MRKQVRYTQLGAQKQVVLQFGVERHEREAVVTDESVNGLGLRLADGMGIEKGQRVSVKHARGEIPATVVRVERADDGKYLIGLQITQPTLR